jgi:hypothetical protein
MKTKTFGELKSEARGRFSYILVFCPNFPPATRATTKTAFEKLISLIDAVLEQTKNDEAKQWLRVCLLEVRASWKQYEDGNRSEGCKLIQCAETYFDNAFSKKPIEPRFIARETGGPWDTEKGFPT